MAINIFQGGKTPQKKVNSGSATERAKKAAAAISAAPSSVAVSDSGNTAVKKQGFLGKVGNFIGKAAGVASKFIPGLGGTIAKGVSNLLNDPEWWQSVPGDALTTNEPLRWITANNDTGSNQMLGRASILEFISNASTLNLASTDTPLVMEVTDAEATQYLMPQIRKVVNAVPLQDAKSYANVLATNATVYALWRTLLKWREMLAHGHTYLASMDDDMFPLFKTENFAYLEATINRLEEYLRSSVRLPHTLCEYLAWRYGRVYSANNSKKSAFILYDAVPISITPAILKNYISRLLALTSASPSMQQANTDMYNAYYDHDMQVEIREDTQFTYDKKEWMLRINMMMNVEKPSSVDENAKRAVVIDSDLDNPTVFMASTVSTYGTQGGDIDILFPVANAYAFMPKVDDVVYTSGLRLGIVAPTSETPTGSIPGFTLTNPTATIISSSWLVAPFSAFTYSPASQASDKIKVRDLCTAMFYAYIAKIFDVYNAGVYLPFGSVTPSTDTGSLSYLVDVTAIGIDTGSVTSNTIGTEHVYAFANLVNVDRKQSTTYKQAEGTVAKDMSNLIDKVDVGSTGS